MRKAPRPLGTVLCECDPARAVSPVFCVVCHRLKRPAAAETQARALLAYPLDQ